MANSARLDELKKKFDENPRRYFAPLANEYRKQGDLAQAIALCRTHLPNQPGHISGHIVLAQALYETRELPESRQSFELALDLDPENLIALRYLGDIAREQGAPANAQVWYQRVLDADPRNDEIAQLLKDVEAEAARAVAELATRPTPVSSMAIAEVPAEPMTTVVEPPQSAGSLEPWAGADENTDEAIESEPIAFATIEDPIDLSEPEAVAEPQDDWFADVAIEAPQAEAADVEVSASFFPDLASAQSIPTTPAAPAEELFESFSMDWAAESAPDAAPAVEPEALIESSVAPAEEPVMESVAEPEPEPVQETVESVADWSAQVDVEVPAIEPVATASTTPVWNQLVESPEPLVEQVPADDDAFAGAVAEADEPFPWESAPRAVDEAQESFASFVAGEPEQQTPEPEPDPMVGRTPAFGSLVQEEPPAPFVTETMAELYLQQGFNEEALAIYKQLLVQNPGDPSLQQRVAALEDGGSSAVVTPLAPPAIVSRGPSVRHFFATFARRNPGDRSAVHEGESEAYAGQSIAGAASAEEGLTRADDAPRSLTEVFSSHGVAAGDAEAATTLASAFGASTSDAVVASELSLQHLFRDVPARSAGAVTQAEFAEASASLEGPALDNEEEAPQADIEQFTAWLEGLKKK